VAGVLLDEDQARRAAQRAFLRDVLAVTPVVDYDPEVTEHHAELLAHTRRSSRVARAARFDDRGDRSRYGPCAGHHRH
jgi:hypothetical protein